MGRGFPGVGVKMGRMKVARWTWVHKGRRSLGGRVESAVSAYRRRILALSRRRCGVNRVQPCIHSSRGLQRCDGPSDCVHSDPAGGLDTAENAGSVFA
jgi:hypothetical protein